MKKYIFSLCLIMFSFLLINTPAFAQARLECTGLNVTDVPACQSVDIGALGFKIPSLADILTFAIRAFFAIAGIAALFYMLIGAFGWVTSGGDKDSITAARERIQAAVIGMILIVAVLALIWTLEQVIFQRRVCLGLSCPVTLPGLIETANVSQEFCCACIIQTGENKGEFTGTIVNTYAARCDENGNAQPL